jgi:hypothetical protein
MSRSDYWLETVSAALDEAELSATTEQIATIAKAVETSADNMSMAFGAPGPSRGPSREELLATLDGMRKQRIPCPTCLGQLEFRDFQGYRQSCTFCRNGKITVGELT